MMIDKRARPAIQAAQRWLQAQKHDGVPRVDRFAADYLGAARGDYSRAWSRYLLTALADRLANPGTKVYFVPAVIAPPRAPVSEAIRALAPWPDLYRRVQIPTSRRRSSLDDLVVELSGAGAMSPDATAHWRAFAGRHQEDDRRQRWLTLHPCAHVAVGTTHDATFDGASELRWLPIKAGRRIDVEAIERDAPQLWAEALAYVEAHGAMAWQDAQREARRAGWPAFQPAPRVTVPVPQPQLEADPFGFGLV